MILFHKVVTNFFEAGEVCRVAVSLKTLDVVVNQIAPLTLLLLALTSFRFWCMCVTEAILYGESLLIRTACGNCFDN